MTSNIPGTDKLPGGENVQEGADKLQQGSTENRESWYYQTYNQQYENWVPWMEEKYLAWFGENKTSYLAKENLSSRGSVNTGVEPVNKLQDGVSEVAGGQLSKEGLLGGVGDMTSKEGVDRTERGQSGGVIDPNNAPGVNQGGSGYVGQIGQTISSYNPLGSSK